VISNRLSLLINNSSHRSHKIKWLRLTRRLNSLRPRQMQIL
jgi:hypothetical protein